MDFILVPKKIQKKELINTHRQRSSDLKQVKDICAKLQIILQVTVEVQKKVIGGSLLHSNPANTRR